MRIRTVGHAPIGESSGKFRVPATNRNKLYRRYKRLIESLNELVTMGALKKSDFKALREKVEVEYEGWRKEIHRLNPSARGRGRPKIVPPPPGIKCARRDCPEYAKNGKYCSADCAPFARLPDDSERRPAKKGTPPCR